MPSAPTTVSGKVGPALTVTSVSLPNVSRIEFRIADGVLSVFYGNGQVAHFDYTQTTTVTDTISGTTSTFSVS